MAIATIGGTKSKLSGHVGRLVYQTRRDAGGNLMQLVGQLPDTKRDTLTPARCRQRLFMSVVMMHQPLLLDFMAAAFEGIPEGTLSVQNFVRQNVSLMQAEGDSIRPYYYRWWYHKYGEKYVLPEPLLITDGTWPTAITDYNIHTSGKASSVSWNTPYVGEYLTLGEYMDKWNFHPDEYLIYIFFVAGLDSRPSRYHYVRINWKNDIDKSQILQRADCNSLFDFAGTFIPSVETIPYDVRPASGFTFRTETDERFFGFRASGAIQVVWRDGQRLVSQCRLRLVPSDEVHGHQRQTIEDVFSSWYDDRI